MEVSFSQLTSRPLFGESKLVGMIYKIPPHLYFVTSAIFHYLGPSFAVLLFARVSVSGVAWLRIVSAAFVFLLWRRPLSTFLRTNKRTKVLILGRGLVFAIMNYSFYYAIDLLPLGTVAAIEFIGPIILALFGKRNLRNLAAVSLAIVGVYLLTDVHFEGEPIGFFWAFANALAFLIYIILAYRLAKSDPNSQPIDRLGAAMIFAAIAITPFRNKCSNTCTQEYHFAVCWCGCGHMFLRDTLYTGSTCNVQTIPIHLFFVCSFITSNGSHHRCYCTWSNTRVARNGGCLSYNRSSSYSTGTEEQF